MFRTISALPLGYQLAGFAAAASVLIAFGFWQGVSLEHALEAGKRLELTERIASAESARADANADVVAAVANLTAAAMERQAILQDQAAARADTLAQFLEGLPDDPTACTIDSASRDRLRDLARSLAGSPDDRARRGGG